MNKKEYAQEIARITNGTVDQLQKANGVIKTAVMIPTGTQQAKAAVYIDEMYENGLTIEEAAGKVFQIIEREKGHQINLDFLKDFEQVKPRLSARLYNKATSADVFRSASQYGFNDLIITAHIKTDIAGGFIRVNQALLNDWNVTADEVLDIAESNSRNDATVDDMQTMLKLMGYSGPEIEGPTMLVISNKDKVCGAYSIITKLDELKARFPEGFIVLPSSVHEVIVTEIEGNEETYTDMVQDVNKEVLNPEETLSDHAYIIAA